MYLDLDPSASPTPEAFATRVNSLLDGAEREVERTRGELSHDQAGALRHDLEHVRSYLEEVDRDGVHGVAIFASSLDEVWRTLTLAARVDDGAWIDDVLQLAPLVPFADEAEGALVAVVGREHGLVYRLRAGRLTEVADESEEAVYGRHDQGGWSQARYQRSVEKEERDHLRHVAETLAAVHRGGVPLVLVVHDEGTRAAFEEELPADVRGSLAGRVHAPAHAGPAELLELVRRPLDEWRRGREEDVLQRWREQAARNGRASSGWADTLEAASDERVDVLLYRPDADRAVWRCPACGRLAAAEGECPVDGTTMERREAGLGHGVQKVLARGGRAWAVVEAPDLDEAGGIGALLRF